MMCCSKATYAVLLVHLYCTKEKPAYNDFYNLLLYSPRYISILRYNGYKLLNTSYLLPYMLITSAKKQFPVFQPFSGTWMPTRNHYWAIWWLAQRPGWVITFGTAQKGGTSASHMSIPAVPKCNSPPIRASVSSVNITFGGVITNSSSLKESSANISTSMSMSVWVS